jgi:chromosome segregation ATPase
MTKLYKQLDDATVAANAHGGVSDVEQDRIDKIQEKIDAVEDARKAYEGTLDEINSDTQKHLDNQLKIWEDHFELLNEKLELEVDINDTQLEEIEYYFDKIADKVYEAVDGYELLSQQFAEQEENYQAQKTYLENLNSAYKNGEIGLTQYKEGLKESQGAILDNLSALEDLKTTMQEYYGDILSMAQEETATFTD